MFHRDSGGGRELVAEGGRGGLREGVSEGTRKGREGRVGGSVRGREGGKEEHLLFFEQFFFSFLGCTTITCGSPPCLLANHTRSFWQ